MFVAPCSHVWHYKCIRPILNDHKTWPQFLCPNCRAVADLEADVDDPNNVSWEEEDAEGSEIGKSETDGVNAATVLPASSEDDDSIVAATSRVSIQNATEETMSDPKTAPRGPPSVSSPPSSLLARRNFANSTPFSLGPDFQQTSNTGNYLRPITPTQSLFSHDDATPNVELANPAMEQNVLELLSNGPMTPTNNAGPFVFDGSAGGAVGHPVAAAVVHNAERSA